MMTLPFEFDTTTSWRKIVTIACSLIAVWALAIAKFLVTRQLASALVALVFGFTFFAFFRRIPRSALRMGAAGSLTSTEVVVHQVKVGPFPLNVPVGRFAMQHFAALSVTERIVVTRSSGTTTNTGSVELVGREGTPNIELMVGPIDAAAQFARDLGSTLGLDVHHQVPDGNRIVKVTF